jgi:hypothetical protein
MRKKEEIMLIKTDLREKALTVSLNISCWSAWKFDKRVTAKINQDMGASSDAGRFNKLLVEKEAIKAVERARNACYTFHYAHTLPWRLGETILKSTGFDHYATTMSKLEEDFWKEVDVFVERYKRLKERAKERLGYLWNEKDYPTVQEVRRKFKFNISYSPLVGADDWRVNLSAKQVEQLAAATAERERELVARSMREAWQRLYDVTKHAVEKLGEADAIFRDSLIGNIIKQCEILPMLNLEEDPDLDRMGREIMKGLGTLDPQSLREDPEGRKRAADEAKEILDKMGGYF